MNMKIQFCLSVDNGRGDVHGAFLLRMLLGCSWSSALFLWPTRVACTCDISAPRRYARAVVDIALPGVSASLPCDLYPRVMKKNFRDDLSSRKLTFCGVVPTQSHVSIRLTEKGW